MFGAWDYLISWGVYISALIAVLFVWWRMTSWISWILLRDWYRVSVVVLFLLPVPEAPGADALAPAFIVTAFEGLEGGIQGAERGGVPLLIGLTAAYLIVFVYHLIIIRENRKR